MSLKKIFLLTFSFLFFFANAQERILNFDVQIDIQESGVIQVTEKIKIKAEGNQFVHGLRRDLLLERKDKEGNAIDVGYKLISIKKDGFIAPYFTKEERKNFIIYIGSKDIELENGIYDYEITYTTPFQIGYFDDYDEIYWNVTGNDWEVVIDNVSCVVYLPKEEVKFISIFSYSGYKGATNSKANSYLINEDTAAFFSVGNLDATEGLTIAASFPNGVVAPPSTFQKSQSFYKQVKEKGWSIIFGIGVLFFVLYQKFNKKGKIVEKTIIPEFQPPFGWSPALVGYVYNNGFNDKTYMASIIHTAIKGALKISYTVQNNTFTTNKLYELEVLNKTPTNLSTEEAAFFKPIAKRAKLVVSNTYHKIFAKAYSGWMSEVTRQIILKEYYINTIRKKIIGFLIYVNFGLIFLLLTHTRGYVNYFFYFIVISGSLAIILWYRNPVKTVGIRIIRGILAFFILIPSVFLYVASLFMMSWIQLGIQGVLLLGYLYYYFTLEKYSIKGVAAIERIKGFKMYLETAEKNRMNTLNPPAKTPELFEELLPYAIALGVDVAWGKQFENVLELAKYDPAWYDGKDDFRNIAPDFISGFTSTVGNSRVDPSPPSSSSSSSGSSGSWSSGSSGGGSSGGGGGW